MSNKKTMSLFLAYFLGLQACVWTIVYNVHHVRSWYLVPNVILLGVAALVSFGGAMICIDKIIDAFCDYCYQLAHSHRKVALFDSYYNLILVIILFGIESILIYCVCFTYCELDNTYILTSIIISSMMLPFLLVVNIAEDGAIFQ